ncbi:MAG TPA: type IV pilus secretin PilQ [Nitrospirota bacterium]|nr:type IV pilus secretin PilQ [Nitrospirota bacterium]
MKRSQLLTGVWVVVFMITAWVLQGCGARPVLEPQKPVVIEGIEPREADGKAEIHVTGSGPIMQYTSSQITEPLRLIVDITDANIEKFQEAIAVNKGPIIDITPSQQDNIARLEIGLTQAIDAKIYPEGGKLIIELGKPGEAAQEQAKAVPEAEKPAEVPKPETAPPTEKPEAALPEAARASIVTSVKATAGRAGVKVIIAANGPMRPNTFMIEGRKLVIDIPGARSTVRPTVIPVRKGGLDRVRVGQHPAPDRKVRVVLDLTAPMEYTSTPEGNKVVIALTATAAPAPDREQPPTERAASQEQAAASEKEVAQAGAPAVAGKKTAPVAAPPAVKERASPGEQDMVSTEETILSGGSKYTGRKISLDLQDADLVNVLRLFADVANLNIILSPEVKGRVTVRMVNIPWDQAMDMILKMNGMGYTRENNILRVATHAALFRETEEEAKAKESKKKAEDLVTRIIAVSYTGAKEMEGTLKKSLSPRGDIQMDERTNTLIIKDLQRNLDDIVALIKILDKPIPQVMIEARVVEATLSFSREIGVQWGGGFTADASHGNPTGLQFPNSIGVTGSEGLGQVPSGTGSFLVNMPAAIIPGTGGGVGFSFGSLNKSLNLDIILSALESTGEGKILSQPRVSALDNKEARITQGFSIPYLNTTSAAGATVQFIDAMLQLIVTPHVTPDNKIFMKVKATKNSPDSSVVVQGLPSIRKNEAETEILLSDGETAVIGGVIVVEKTQSVTKVPFFGDLPLIGWLFRHNAKTESKRELLIFLTPRIMHQEAI